MAKATPDRLKQILGILANHHQSVNQSFTLASQDPQDTIHTMKTTLSNHGDILEEYLRWHTIPEKAKKNEQLMNTIGELSLYVEPWDPEISTLAPRWCYIMFKDFPLTISPEHINTLYKNSMAELDEQ